LEEFVISVLGIRLARSRRRGAAQVRGALFWVTGDAASEGSLSPKVFIVRL